MNNGAIQMRRGVRIGWERVLVLAFLAQVVLGQGGDPEASSLPPAEDQQLREAIQEQVSRIDRTYVVTATRHSDPSLDLPFFTSVPDESLVRRSRLVQDALRETAGVQLQRTSYGQTSPILRGLTGYHTLMLVDGIRLNNSVVRSGPNEYWGLVDGLSLDRLEVVLGPGSVLYGSDAVGGSVNGITRRMSPFGRSAFQQRAYLRYSTAENSIVGRGELAARVEDRFGLLIGGDLASFDDLHAGGAVGRQPHTGYHQGFGDVSLDVPVGDHWSVRLLGQLARQDDIARVHSTVNGVRYRGTTIGSDRRRNLDFDRNLAAVIIRGDDLDGAVDGLELRLSWQNIKEEEDRVRSNGRRTLQGFDVDTLGVALELTQRWDRLRLTFGADWYHDDVDSFRENYDAAGMFTGSSIQGPVGDDARYDTLGVFAQAEWELLPSLDLIASGRLTWSDARANKVEDPDTGAEISVDDDWLAAVGSLRLAYQPLDGWSVFGGASQAFRAPNLSDLTRFDSARSNEIEVPTSDLDPERFLSLEVGTKVQMGGFAVQFAYHYTILDDLIIRQPTGAMIGTDSVVLKRNGGDGHVQGIDLSVLYELDENWSAFGSFQWLDGQEETFPTSAPNREIESLTRLSPINGTVGVRWQTSDERFWVRGWVQIVDAQNRVNTRDRGDTQRIPPGGSPGYTIWNLEAGYALDPDKRFFLALENIGDKNYRIHGSGVQEAGFNVVIGADFTF